MTTKKNAGKAAAPKQAPGAAATKEAKQARTPAKAAKPVEAKAPTKVATKPAAAAKSAAVKSAAAKPAAAKPAPVKAAPKAPAKATKPPAKATEATKAAQAPKAAQATKTPSKAAEATKAPAKAATKTPAKAAEAPKATQAAKAPAKPAAASKAAQKPAAASKAAQAPAELAEASEPAEATSVLALQILSADLPAPQVAELGVALLDSSSAARSTNAAKVLAELIELRLELLVPQVDKFAKTIASKNKRVAQTSADALPGLARVAPARVARHLELLRTSFGEASIVGKDGLVRTFAALCTASVAYQKRLEPVLTTALGEADGKVLLRWSQVVLPALKGEPHARARAVVEERLDRIPRAYAQQIADFLGIKLRTRYR